jgi:aspartyl protease family protein
MKAFWAVIGGVGAIYVLFPARSPAPVGDPAPPTVALTPAKKTSTPPLVSNVVTLPRAPDGHFYAEALVNGAPIRFIVDTGATRVALTRADAQRAGLTFTDADFTGTAKGAGGDVKIATVQLDRVTLGPHDARQVDAAIVAGDMSVSLLGQSWLKTIGTVSISNNTMVLR